MAGNRFFNLGEKKSPQGGKVAVIGIGLRLAGLTEPKDLWEKLAHCCDFVGELPECRGEDVKDYFKIAGLNSRIKFKEAAYLDRIDDFDAPFFQITQHEAMCMEPAQRLFLQTAWHCLENGGYSPESLKGSKTAVYVGYGNPGKDYQTFLENTLHQSDAQVRVGNIPSIISSRLSYALDLRGPSMMIDTACSSGLVALSLATRSILSGESDMAIAGGINILLTPVGQTGIVSGLGIESIVGRARTFDAWSDGTGFGEGVICLLLKPLERAIADNDSIWGTIIDSAINQDGRSQGITAPNVAAQEDLLTKLYQAVPGGPESLSYIEAHGTGTSLGDPIEVAALTSAFSRYTNRKQFCAIGSSKANMGHLDAAAGLLGVVKVLLAMKNKQIPGHPFFDLPNPKIDFENSPFFVADRTRPWPSGKHPRRAGVSSFGISGTNCHVILEESPDRESIQHEQKALPFVFSAKSKTALLQLARLYVSKFDGTEPDMYQLCASAALRRTHYNFRVCITVTGINSLLRGLRSFIEHPDDARGTDFLFGELTARASVKKSSSTNGIGTAGGVGAFEAGLRYIVGADPGWSDIFPEPFQYERLPVYPFDRIRCWPDLKNLPAAQPVGEPHAEMEKSPKRPTTKGALGVLVDYIANAFSIKPADVDIDSTFFSLGLDSISVVQVRQLLKREFDIQVDIADLFSKIDTLRKLSEFVESAVTVHAETPGDNDDLSALSTGTSSQHERSEKAFVPFQKAPDTELHADNYNSVYLRNFLQDFLTPRSKTRHHVEEHRMVLANNRYVLGYKKQLKPLIFPLVASKAEGCRFWDLDGNEYLDFTMGFGVFLFGYKHQEIQKAMLKQVEEGVFLGPLSPLAGEVAMKISRLTGVDRVAFFNSGTEAVMVAVRLARAYTSRSKIVVFSGSYHGTYDGIMAQADRFSKDRTAVPFSFGVPESLLADVYVLEYGDTVSLEFIAGRNDIAAVLVEPVQSRRPEFQPVQFLKDLRKVTAEKRIVLIFDEIITGFRSHPGGVQAMWNIKADLSTYGKVIAAGMPIGVVAGKQEFMSGIDGGVWSFDDDSEPTFDHRRVMVAGTFCQHPMSLAAANAALQIMIDKGTVLQDDLNNKTLELVRKVSDILTRHNAAIDIYHFGSLFQFRSQHELSMFFNALIKKNIYVWEGRTFFLSTAHTDGDIDLFVRLVDEVCDELSTAGFLPLKRNHLVIPFTEDQKRLLYVSQSSDYENAFKERLIVELPHDTNTELFESAYDIVTDRHEMLRVKSHDENCMHVGVAGKKLNIVRMPCAAADPENGLAEFVERTLPEVTLDAPVWGGLVMFSDKTYFCFLFQHAFIDGWSVEVLKKELSQVYSALAEGIHPRLASPGKFSDYVSAVNKIPDVERNAALKFWSNEYETFKNDTLFHNPFLLNKSIYHGRAISFGLSPASTKFLKDFSKVNDFSLMAVLLGLLTKWSTDNFNKTAVTIAIPFAGQLDMDNPNIMGQCVQMLPLCISVSHDEDITAVLSRIKDKLRKVLNFKLSAGQLSDGDDSRESSIELPGTQFVFNLDAPIQTGAAVPMEFSERKIQCKYGLFVNAVEVNESLFFEFQYAALYFPGDSMRQYLQSFSDMAEGFSNMELRTPLTSETTEGQVHSLADAVFPVTDRYSVLVGEWSSDFIDEIVASVGQRSPNAQVMLVTRYSSEIAHNSHLIGDLDLLHSLRREAGTFTVTILSDRPLVVTDIPAGVTVWYGHRTSSGVKFGWLVDRPTFEHQVILPIGFPLSSDSLSCLPPDAKYFQYPGGLVHLYNYSDSLFSYRHWVVDRDVINRIASACDEDGDPLALRNYIPVPFLMGSDDDRNKHNDVVSDEAKFLAMVGSLTDLASAPPEYSFLELGGNSIKALILQSRVRKTFGREIKLSEILQAKSVGSLFQKFSELTGSQRAFVRTPVSPRYELSHAQKRMWISEKNSAGSGAYTLHEAKIVEGKIDIALLQRALQKMIVKHEALRTVFVETDLVPWQVIRESEMMLPFEVVDLRANPDRDQVAVSIVKDMTRMEFDLEKGPLWKVVWIRLLESKNIYSFSVHHIIFDGWSADVFFNDLIHYYRNQSAVVKEPSSRYVDFSGWEKKWLTSKEADVSRRHWLSKLRGRSGWVTTYPADYPRPSEKKYAAGSALRFIENRNFDGVGRVCKDSNTSIFNFLHSLLVVHLSHYTGTNVVIGMPASGRSMEEMKDVIGCFINTILLVTPYRPDQQFRELLADIAAEMNSALDHQFFPYDLLVKELGEKTDPSRNIMFDIGCTFHEKDYSQEGAPIGKNIDLSVRNFPVLGRSVKTDLWFHFVDHRDHLEINCLYDLSLFEGSTVERFMDEFMYLLALVSANPAMTVRELHALMNEKVVGRERETTTKRRTQNLKNLLK